MKSLLAGLILIAAAAPALAAQDIGKETAIATWRNELTIGQFADLNAQAKELKEKGYTKLGKFDAIALGGSCGVASCDSTYLVTTALSSAGSNARTEILAGIVAVSFPSQGLGSVLRVLSREEIDGLRK
jgi:hypothetical protein